MRKKALRIQAVVVWFAVVVVGLILLSHYPTKVSPYPEKD